MTDTHSAPSMLSHADAGMADFLASVRRSGALADLDYRKLCSRVEAGRYPAEPVALAAMLVAKRVMTDYQARRVLGRGGYGLTLGRYVILDRLGRGSMGRVYRALHRPMGRVVALKVIDVDRVCRRNALPRFRREMQMVGRLDHPNIVRAFDADEDGPAPYLAMEYLPGRSLDQVVEDGRRLEPGRVVEYARQAALGLAHAHARGVIHRDIKPSNLMVDGAGGLKILDFGVGIFTGMRAGDPKSGLTADGLTVGTVEYMSPEQATGRAVDGRSDLYSLGCVMYHLLTGQLPFSAPDRVTSLAMRIDGRAEPMAGLRSGLPPELVGVVGRLMEHRPEDRYRDGEEAAEAMGSLAA